MGPRGTSEPWGRYPAERGLTRGAAAPSGGSVTASLDREVPKGRSELASGALREAQLTGNGAVGASQHWKRSSGRY
jgi:hypothetical protein